MPPRVRIEYPGAIYHVMKRVATLKGTSLHAPLNKFCFSASRMGGLSSQWRAGARLCTTLGRRLFTAGQKRFLDWNEFESDLGSILQSHISRATQRAVVRHQLDGSTRRRSCHQRDGQQNRFDNRQCQPEVLSRGAVAVKLT